MKGKKNKTTYFYIDEAGDPIFYNRKGDLIVGNEGCSKILLIGFVRTQDPKHIREALLSLKRELSKDKYLKNIPSIKKSLRAFHAKDDCQEVRQAVYKMILKLNFKAEFIVARKIESIFKKRHKSKENIFYDDLLAKLFENKLHISTINKIYYSVRGNRIRQEPISSAIQTAILTFEKKWKKKVNSQIDTQAQTLSGEPCLQVIDYMSWAVQRAFIKKEMRYFDFVGDKISYLVDLYDFDKYPKNFYHSRNQFDINKISPL